MSILDGIDPHFKSGKRESYETIFNVSNTMMGTALLIMPCNFYSSGVISSIIAALVMMLVSYWTCNLVIIHSRDDEVDYPQAIKRLLGEFWCRVFNFISFLLIFLVAIIHFILMANVCLSIIKNISGDSEHIAGLKEITFKKFSMQYMGIILFIVCGFLYSIKDIKKLLVINEKGIFMIILFCIFIVFLGIRALSTEEITFINTGKVGAGNEGLQLILFDTDLTELIGVFCVAYLMHNVVAGMMKSNKNPNNNSRDLFISYSIVFIIYTLLGLFGCFGVAALYHHDYKNSKGVQNPIPKSILELLSVKTEFLSGFTRTFGLISLFFVFVQLITVLPILTFFTRRQFFALIFGNDKEIPQLHNNIFNVVFNLICLGFEIPVFEPSVVVAWTGALGCLMLIYVIPILCHLSCLYYNKTEAKLDEKSIDDRSFSLKDKSGAENAKDKNELLVETSEIKSDNNCCRNDYTHEKRYSKLIIYPFYGILMSFGFAVLVVSIYNNVK